MLSLQNAGKRFGPRVLFLEANWLIRAREKTALVGANGAGKSTIMKVLAGLETLDYGQMQQTRGMSIGYLPQEGLALTGRSVFEECLTVFDELRDMAREVERLGGQLSVLEHAGPEYEAAAERYSRSVSTRSTATRWTRRWAACCDRAGIQQGRLDAPDG
jgi:ATP-binding cassette subfamily F protein 3